MNSPSRRVTAIALFVALYACAWTPATAHRTVISQYTFSQHVLPILRARCGACHADEGPAPAPLLRYADARAVSWRMQQELLAGRMPPWEPDGSGEPVRDAQRLTPNEFDVLMTWAAGGTPEGPAGQVGSPTHSSPEAWPLGQPDVVLALPESQASGLAGSATEREYLLPITGLRGRFIRAVDLRPGPGANVRRADLALLVNGQAQTIGLWLPGEQSPSLGRAAFRAAPGATLRVRLWHRPRRTADTLTTSGPSSVGLYVGARGSLPVDTLTLAEGTTPVDARARAVAWHVVSAAANTVVRVTLVKADGTERPLVRARPSPAWPRRYVFERPVEMPAGSRLVVSTSPTSASPLDALLGTQGDGSAPIAPLRIALDITR